MGHLTPVLVATESFGRDLRKILTRHRAAPELIREVEQNFTVWKASIRQFHDSSLTHTSVTQSALVKSSNLAQFIGEKVTLEIIDDVCERQIPQLEINNANRKLAEATEKMRQLEIQVRQQEATNEVMQTQNDRQADSQLTLAQTMFEEVFQLRTTIAELTAIALDPTGALAEKYSRESQKVKYSRARSDSLLNRTSNTNNNFGASATNGDLLLSRSNSMFPSQHQQLERGASGILAAKKIVRKPVIEVVKTDFISPAEKDTINVDVRTIVRPEKVEEQQQQSSSSPPSDAQQKNPKPVDSLIVGESTTENNNNNTITANSNNNKSMRKRAASITFGTECGPNVNDDFFTEDIPVDSNMGVNQQQQQQSSNIMNPNSSIDHRLSPAGRRRINPKSGGVGPYAIFDYETFIENFEKTRGAKVLAEQLEELKAAFAAYVEKSNLDRAGIASSFQFQLDAKSEQIAALKLALLQALGTAPTLAKMVRTFMSRVLKIELEQLKRRMRHLQQAVKVWIDHILKHVSVMGARFDVFVRFCGNIFQELSDHVGYAVQQRFPLAPGATPNPPPAIEPLWHFFVLKGDDDPEEEAKAYWQNHEATHSVALLHINMCEALKEVHFALRLASQLKNPYYTNNNENSNDNNDNNNMNIRNDDDDGCSNPTTSAALGVAAAALIARDNNNNKGNKNSKNKLGERKMSNMSQQDPATPTLGGAIARNNSSLKKMVSFSNTNAFDSGGLEGGDTSSQLLSTSGALALSSNNTLSGGKTSNKFALRKRPPPPPGQHTITFTSPLQASDDLDKSALLSDDGSGKRKIRSLYAGTSWEALDSHRQGIDQNFGDGGLFQRGGASSHGNDGSFVGSPGSSTLKGAGANILKSLDQWTQNMGSEMFFGASYSQQQQNQQQQNLGNTFGSFRNIPGGNSSSVNNNNNNMSNGALAASIPGANASVSNRGGGRRRGRAGRYDDWTVETSVENVKFLRGLSKRCVQLSVRSILSRVHLRARRQLLLKKMPAEQRNAYLTIAALDREIAHVTDVIDGCRGNGYLAKFRAVETEQIIQAWKSTGRRGKPVITGDSDEDDPRVLPVHAPAMVPVRNLDTIRGKKDGGKAKDSIQKFRLTLGQTGGTSNALEAGDDDDGTLGDPVKLVQEMITTGTLWAQSGLGKDSKGAYRARQDVLYELIDQETKRMKSSEGFKTRRKRRFLRMLNYLKNKVGFAESAINAARSGTTSTAVQEGTTLLKQFIDNFGVDEEENLEIDELDPANASYFLHRSSADIKHVRGSAGSFLTNSWRNSFNGNNNNNNNSNDGSPFDGSAVDSAVGAAGSLRGGKKFSSPTNKTGNHDDNGQSPMFDGRREILRTAKTQLQLSLAGDGSNRWKYSRKDGGAIHGLFNSIDDTISKNRSDILSLQRLGLTEDQIKLMQIQSLRGRAHNPPADLKEFLSMIHMSYEVDDDDGDEARNSAHRSKSRNRPSTSEILDEAMQKLRDDLFFGKNNTDLWFGMNNSLWIPTPGQDMPQELKDHSRDVALRRAMTALLALGALTSVDDEEGEGEDNNDEGVDVEVDEEVEEQNEKGETIKIVRKVIKKANSNDKSKTVTTTSLSFSPAPPSSRQNNNNNNKSSSPVSSGLLRKGIQKTTFQVREASVERNDGDAELGAAFSAHTLNPPKIIESEAPPL